MDLKLDKDTLSALVSTAIMEKISQEQRDILIRDAIEHLLTPVKKTSHYSDRTVLPLQEAFRSAAESATSLIVRDLIKDDPKFQEAIKNVVSKAFIQFGTDQSDEVSRDMAKLIGVLFEKAAKREY